MRIRTNLFKIDEPPKNHYYWRSENYDIMEILKRSVKGKLVIAYFEKNKKLSQDMSQKLADSLIENVLIDDLNRRLYAEDLTRLAECIAEVFPPESKETYFASVRGKINKAKGKLFCKYYNLRRQCQSVALIPSKKKPKSTLGLTTGQVEDTNQPKEFLE